jgi:hypothetical protein
MLERAAQKLRLDQLVIQQGRQQQSKGTYDPLYSLNISHAALDLVSRE